jgi:hypothetical protein
MCEYYDETQGAWTGEGVAVVGVMRVGGVDMVGCMSTHLSLFSAIGVTSLPFEVNAVDPVSNLHMVPHVIDPSNIVGLVFLVGSVVLLVAGYCAAVQRQPTPKVQKRTASLVFQKQGSLDVLPLLDGVGTVKTATGADMTRPARFPQDESTRAERVAVAAVEMARSGDGQASANRVHVVVAHKSGTGNGRGYVSVLWHHVHTQFMALVHAEHIVFGIISVRPGSLPVCVL